jgi:hypothetical protein
VSSTLPPGYAGNWTGTTSQGTAFRFTASEADTVTSITLTYNFSATCAGTLTYTNLAVPIHTLDPPGPPPYDQPGFGYTVNNIETGTLIAGLFTPNRQEASGQFTLVKSAGCDGVATGSWNATRR